MSGIKKRLHSLDIFRGLTVALMIVVNNGYGDDQFSTLNHSHWNGLTVCDLVFPFFLFMVGVSAYLALRRCDFQPRRDVIKRICYRSCMFFLIGLGLHIWEMLVDGNWQIVQNLRLWGVMQRIALCYFFVSMTLLYVKPKALTIIAGAILVVYSAILILGNGYAQDETNILSIVDRWIVSPAHLYRKSPVDPEGLLGAFSSFAHVAIGAYIGYSICHKTELTERMRRVSGLGFFMLIVGLLVSIWLPINKRVWSSSYVLVTCGIASLVLIVLTYLADHKDKWKWFDVFRRAGLHAFLLYVISEMLAPVIGKLGMKEYVYSQFATVFSPEWSSFAYSLLFAAFLLLFCYMSTSKKLMGFALVLVGCDKGELKFNYVPEEFVTEIKLKFTSVKNQGRSELCWIYSSFAVLESEMMMKGDSVNLSTNFIARKYLEDIFRDYYLSKGQTRVDLRGGGPMAIDLTRRYGVVPDEAYLSKRDVDYFGLINEIKSIADSALVNNDPLDVFQKKVISILDNSIGEVPDSVELHGKMVTPKEYGQYLLADREYIVMMSNKKFPIGKNVDPKLKDNRLGCLAENVSGDTLAARVLKSLQNGKAVMLEGGPNDNHAVAIVGMGHDKRGVRYFVAKNSWGTNNPTSGFFFIEESYLKKHTALVMSCSF